MPKVLVPLAQGCEELEAVSIIDVLRRAGVEVVTAGLTEGPVKAARGTVLLPDTTLAQASNGNYDLIALPGGQPGTNNLKSDQRILDLLRAQSKAGRFSAAICAAPMVLAEAGILDGRRATAFPNTLSNMNVPGLNMLDEAVVIDGKIITSKSAGTAMDFALELVELLCGASKRSEVEKNLYRS